MVRIGMVEFINTAPIYEVWRERVREPDWRVVCAVPSRLNRMIREGGLDLGFVSSLEFARHPELYLIMPGISISSTGAVGSVFLLSRKPFAELEGGEVVFSGQSRSSSAMARIVCEEFIGVRPAYRQAGLDEDWAGAGDAVVVIGDEALRLAVDDRRFPYRLDLGESWFAHTGLPFVFALWVARRDFIARRPGEAARVVATLGACLDEGKKRLGRISRAVAPRVPMDEGACYRYLNGLEYDLGPDKQAGLREFYRFLARRGEVPGPVDIEVWQAADRPVKSQQR